MNQLYDRYEHLFSGLALWHLWLNYLKMIWELFYLGESSTERSTLQWAADHWHRNKTTKQTNFHSLEDLTIHSYRARIITILKPWIHKQAPKKLWLYRNQELGTWLGQLTPSNWVAAIDGIDCRLRTKSINWNNHWNNHIRFCMVLEPYMTLSYTIKYGDIGFLCHIMQEISIILQAPAANKPKYARAMLRQLHIFDTKASAPQLQKSYLANVLVNPWEFPHSFYKIDLLLKHQTGDFKHFCTDRGSSWQETN